MKKQFVSYEIALALKELGFDEECIGFYYNENNFEIAVPDVVKVMCNKFNYIKAPLWQQVIEWLREVHKKDVYCWPCESQIDDSNTTWTSGKSVGTYEEALEVGLINALKSI